MTVDLFTITPTPPTSITLAPDKVGTYPEGTFSFTVTCLGAPDTSYELILQALLVGADGKTGEVDWLAVGPKPTLSMTGGATQAVVITARPTAASPRGRHNLELAVADKARPFDTYAYSAPVVCEIEAPGAVIAPIRPARIPRWLIAVLAGGGGIVGGGIVLAGKLASAGGTPTVVDAAVPKVFAPLHVQTVLPGAPDRIGPGAIDTTARTIDGATSPFFVQQGDYAVLFANAFMVQRPLVITGKFPLIVVASDQVTIAFNIDLEASGAASGPGAAPANHPGAGGAGATALGSGEPPVRSSSGGGGGSHGSFGAPGGSSSPALTPPGASGVWYGMQPGDPLLGGAPGGSGGNSSGTGAGVSGGGGGALQISSAVSIQVSATIDAGGGGGGGGGPGDVGGGGGGAGGEILLEATVIKISGTLAANGGGGGGGGASGTSPGRDGDPGTPGSGPAAGGAGGVPRGSPGGAGAAGVTGDFREAVLGGNTSSNGGGGGGGAGQIWLRYRAATPPSVTGGHISPPPGMDPTLP